MSRIHARRIFPGERLLPASAFNQGEKSLLPRGSAQPAQRDPERSTAATAAPRAPGFALGGTRGARGRSLLPPAPAPAARAAPRERGALSLVGSRRGVGAPGRLLSGALRARLVVWTPPRTPSWWGGAVSGSKDEMRRLQMQLRLKFGVGGRAEGARDSRGCSSRSIWRGARPSRARASAAAPLLLLLLPRRRLPPRALLLHLLLLPSHSPLPPSLPSLLLRAPPGDWGRGGGSVTPR